MNEVTLDRWQFEIVVLSVGYDLHVLCCDVLDVGLVSDEALRSNLVVEENVQLSEVQARVDRQVEAFHVDRLIGFQRLDVRVLVVDEDDAVGRRRFEFLDQLHDGPVA